jgi:ribosomal protein S13
VTMTFENQSLEQRMAALERANVIRSRRAQLKRDLKAGRVRIHDLLVHPPDWLDTAKVATMLLQVPKVGRVKAAKALRVCDISPSKTFGGLTERQRVELVAYLSGTHVGGRLSQREAVELARVVRAVSATQAGGRSRPPRDYPEVDPRGSDHTP